MSAAIDALNMAEAARQVGNLDLALRILIKTMEENMEKHNDIINIDDVLDMLREEEKSLRAWGRTLEAETIRRMIDKIAEAHK